MTHFLASFLLGFLAHALYERWRAWERGTGLTPTATWRADSWYTRKVNFRDRDGSRWALEVQPADPPDPRTVDLASYPDRYAETHGS